MKPRRAMRYARHLLPLVAAYCIALLTTAPASLLLRPGLLPPGLALEQVRGSLWQGEAHILRIASPAGAIAVPDLRWSVGLPALLRGQFALTLETSAAVGSARLVYGAAGWRVAHADLALPADDLGRLVPPLGLWQPGGEVQIQTGDFPLSAAAPGLAILTWRHASLGLMPLATIGDYRLQLSGHRDGIALQLESLRGPLQIQGNGEYSARGGLQFHGEARAEAGQEQALRALLLSLGKEDGAGGRAWNLRWP